MGQSACGYICNKDRENNTYFFPESDQKSETKKSSYDSISNPEYAKAVDKRKKEIERTVFKSNTSKNGYDSSKSASDDILKMFRNESLLRKLIRLQSIVRGEIVRSKVKTQLAENYKTIFKSFYDKFNLRKIEENEKKFHEFQNSEFNLAQTGEKKFFNKLMIEEESFYVGEVNLKNEKHGYGRLIDINGNVFQGNWIKNKLTGKGRKIDSKGILYEGILIVFISQTIFNR
jgi:hypothetical protein